MSWYETAFETTLQERAACKGGGVASDVESTTIKNMHRFLRGPILFSPATYLVRLVPKYSREARIAACTDS